MITRTERQKQCLINWLKSGGAATVVACTGFGKTRVALNLISAFVKRNDESSALIVVPTEPLKEQWIDELDKRGLLDNARVEIINTVVKYDWTCDLLVVDEIHLMAADTFSKVFEKVSYKNILGLTATFERLDGKEILISKYAPVCDTIDITLAEKNGWVAPHREYLVLLDVDLKEYNELTKEFNQCFAQFDWDFNLAMDCATDIIKCRTYAKKMGLDCNTVMGVAQKWNRAMRKRKEFIYNHPKKMEVAKKILEARKDKKGITFSSTIKQAESFGSGWVMHSKKKKKENKATINAFDAANNGFLHTSKAADQGLDCKGINLEIILHTDSSKVRKTQRIGRAIRFEEGKTSEIFTLVLRGTQELNWFNNSNTSRVTTINEAQLDRILAGESIETREREIVTNTKFRY